MSQNNIKSCEIDPREEDKVDVDKNNKTNTLKNVKRKIRKTLRKKFGDEKLKNENDSVSDEKSDKVDNTGDEGAERSKFTLKKIFRKSSFRKIITNIQQFTNFTVSTLIFSSSSFIQFLIEIA
jgi:hypothetical protein